MHFSAQSTVPRSVSVSTSWRGTSWRSPPRTRRTRARRSRGTRRYTRPARTRGTARCCHCWGRCCGCCCCCWGAPAAAVARCWLPRCEVCCWSSCCRPQLHLQLHLGPLRHLLLLHRCCGGSGLHRLHRLPCGLHWHHPYWRRHCWPLPWCPLCSCRQPPPSCCAARRPGRGTGCSRPESPAGRRHTWGRAPTCRPRYTRTCAPRVTPPHVSRASPDGRAHRARELAHGAGQVQGAVAGDAGADARHLDQSEVSTGSRGGCPPITAHLLLYPRLVLDTPRHVRPGPVLLQT